jgi:leader peptidase (prepilin peptidase)/N-methyltransferase
MIFDLNFPPTLLALTGLLFGSIVGSFLNVVILRLPMMLQAEWGRESRLFLGLDPLPEETISLSKPRSRCPHCGTAVKAIHNIPILSYCYLRGRCSACGTAISMQYPLIELATGLLTAYLLTAYGLTLQTCFSIIFSYALIVLAMIDVREKLLPDHITLPLLWLGLILNLNGFFVGIEQAVIGAVLGYLPLWLLFWLFKWLTGKEGMGYGDFKLNAAIGAWLGWQMVPVVILLSSFLGTLVACCGILFAGRDKNIPFAFGPYLCLSGWIAMQWGENILYYFAYLSF